MAALKVARLFHRLALKPASKLVAFSGASGRRCTSAWARNTLGGLPRSAARRSRLGVGIFESEL